MCVYILFVEEGNWLNNHIRQIVVCYIFLGFFNKLICICVSVITDVVGHHDGEQRLVVGVERDVERGGLDHDEDGVEDWGTATQENKWFNNWMLL